MYCSSCGALVDTTWRFCPKCSAPIVAESPPARPFTLPSTAFRSRWAAAAGFLFLVSAGLTVGALFPAYYRGGTALSRSVSTVWYNVPAIVGWSLAGLMLLMRRGRLFGAGLACGLTGIWLSAYLGEFDPISRGTARIGPGMALGEAGIALALIGSVGTLVLVIRERRVGLLRGARGAAWAMIAAAAGLAFAVGDAFPWVDTHIHATAASWRFAATGTSDVSTHCCTIGQQHGWSLAQQMLLVSLAVLVPLVVGPSRPGLFAIGGLFGAALALLAAPISAIVGLLRPLTAAGVGMTAADANVSGAVFSQHGLPGLWLALAAGLAIILMAIARWFVTDDRRVGAPGAHE